MKILDYCLSAHYIALPEGNKRSELMYVLSNKEPWPNELVQINGINLLFRGKSIAQIYASDRDYTEKPGKITMLYGFPISDDGREESEPIYFNMPSRRIDLRPILYKTLLDECGLVVKLPKTEYQKVFCKSLLSNLEIK